MTADNSVGSDRWHEVLEEERWKWTRNTYLGNKVGGFILSDKTEGAKNISTSSRQSSGERVRVFSPLFWVHLLRVRWLSMIQES